MGVNRSANRRDLQGAIASTSLMVAIATHVPVLLGAVASHGGHAVEDRGVRFVAMRGAGTEADALGFDRPQIMAPLRACLTTAVGEPLTIPQNARSDAK
jgi:hypothetical protein